MAEPIVAIGLLSESDLKRLGTGFRRYFPVQKDDVFADLIAQLDAIPAVKPNLGNKVRGKAQE